MLPNARTNPSGKWSRSCPGPTGRSPIDCRLAMKTTKRECGACNLCCKLLGISEIKKPTGQWCGHVKCGKGCSIYDNRPNSCRGFDCLWLQGAWPKALKPNKTKVVPTTDQGSVVLYVDSAIPSAFRSPEMIKVIDRLLNTGPVFVVLRKSRFMLEKKGQTVG
jgi:uncharacterized protein